MPTAAVLAVTAVAGAVASSKASSKASKASSGAADKASLQTLQATNRARDDVNRLFPQAQQSAQLGFQGALDVFGQSLPAQTDVFQQGNLGAQQAILSGLPQIQNALFGNQVDLSQLQPFQVQQPDLSFFNQTLPQFANPGDGTDRGSRLAAASQGQFRGVGPNIGNISGNLLGGGTPSLGGNMQAMFQNQER